MSKRILSAAMVAAMIFGAGQLALASPNASDPVETLLDQAIQLKKDKKWEESLDFYEAAIKISPKNVEAWVGKSWIHNELGEYAEAIKAAETAIKFDPKNSDAWTELGYGQHKTKKLLRAKESFDNALKFDPNNNTAKGYRTEVMKDLGEDE